MSNGAVAAETNGDFHQRSNRKRQQLLELQHNWFSRGNHDSGRQSCASSERGWTDLLKECILQKEWSMSLALETMHKKLHRLEECVLKVQWGRSDQLLNLCSKQLKAAYHQRNCLLLQTLFCSHIYDASDIMSAHSVDNVHSLLNVLN